MVNVLSRGIDDVDFPGRARVGLAGLDALKGKARACEVATGGAPPPVQPAIASNVHAVNTGADPTR